MILRRPLLIGAAAAGLTAIPGFAQTAPGFDGEWNGDLHVGPNTLRLHLVIAAGPSATLFSVDQGNARIPAANVHIDGSIISMTFPSVNASYTGTLSNGRITGQFTQGVTLSLEFAPGPMPTTAAAAPSPPPPLEHLTQEILRGLRVQSGAPAMALATSCRGPAG